MNCKKCGIKITRLRKPYFSGKLKCTYCNITVDYWDMTLQDYWYDFLKLVGVVG